MKPKIAIIGAGPAGLAAAYQLRNQADLTVFDSASVAGGHAHTVEVDEGDTRIGLDTAFIIFNKNAYPQMNAVFDELGVESLDHVGGFNYYDLDTGVEFGTREFDLSEEVIAEGYPAEFVEMWREARRFQAEGPRDFIRKRADVSLADYLDANGYSDSFKYGYVVLLSTAVWSIPPEQIWSMPASTLIAFYLAHDAEGLGGRSVAWRTVAGGSISYVRKVSEAVGPVFRLSEPVVSVREDASGVVVASARASYRFDQVVIATHADDAFRILDDPTDDQRLLSRVTYNEAEVVLHTDPSVMPPDRSRWASWNYAKVLVDGEIRAFPTYYLNILQGLQNCRSDYFVTIDSALPIDPARVIEKMRFRHPVITVDVREMQRDIYRLNSGSRIKFAGSYFHSKKLGIDQIGSHEAAFGSGMSAAGSVVADFEQYSYDATGAAEAAG